MSQPSAFFRSWSSAVLFELRKAWQTRSPNERVLIAIAAALLVIVLALVLSDWLRAERRRLVRILPRMEAQVLAMEAAESEIASLRAQPVAAATPPSTQALADAATARASAQGLSLVIKSAGETVTVRGSAPFDILIQWLGSVHQQEGLRVQKAEIQQTGNGEASVDIVLVAAARR